MDQSRAKCKDSDGICCIDEVLSVCSKHSLSEMETLHILGTTSIIPSEPT